MTTENKEITINVPMDRIEKAVYDAMDNILKSSYGNPVKDAVEAVFKEKAGEVKAIVGEIISNSLNNPTFKEKLGEMVMQNMINIALKK